MLGDNRQDARGVVREARAAHCRDGARAADIREALLPHAVRELDAQPDGGKNHDLHGRETVEDRCDGSHGKGIAQGQPGAAVAPASYACAVLGGSEGRGENREDEEPGHGHGAAGVQDVHEIEDERAHDAVSWRAGGKRGCPSRCRRYVSEAAPRCRSQAIRRKGADRPYCLLGETPFYGEGCPDALLLRSPRMRGESGAGGTPGPGPPFAG